MPLNLKKQPQVYIWVIQRLLYRVWHERLTVSWFYLKIPGSISHLLDSYLKDFPIYICNTLQIPPYVIPISFPWRICSWHYVVTYKALKARGYWPRFAEQKLQRHISLLEQWFRKWRVYINLDNKTVILFTWYKHRLYLNYDYSVIQFLAEGKSRTLELLSISHSSVMNILTNITDRILIVTSSDTTVMSHPSSNSRYTNMHYGSNLLWVRSMGLYTQI
jgi:hypothetical protein